MWKEEIGIISKSLPDVSFEVYYFWFTQYSFKKIMTSTNQFSVSLFYAESLFIQHVVEEDPELLHLPPLFP